MKRHLTLSAILICAAPACASPFLASIITPSAKDMNAACDESVQIASQPISSDPKELIKQLTADLESEKQYARVISPTGGDQIKFQTPLGSVSNICYNRTKKLQPRPDVTALATTPIFVYVSGVTSELKYARDWAVALSFVGSDGKEIKRYFATDSRLGDTDDWKVDCKNGNCTWSGKNTYIFDTKKMDGVADAASRASKLMVMVSRNGINQYEVSEVTQATLK